MFMPYLQSIIASPVTFMDLMEPVFNQALKGGHVGFVTVTYTMYKQQSLKSYKHSRRGVGCFVQQWCMQQKVHLLNVNSIGQNMGEEIYSSTLFNRL